MSTRTGWAATLAIAIASAAIMAGPAMAAFPGANGKIAVTQGRIFVLNPDGSERFDTGLAARGGLSISPDGTRMAYVSDPGYDIFTAALNGTGVTQVTNTPGVIEDAPTWLADGRIAFHVLDGGPVESFAINPDGSGTTDLGEIQNVVTGASPSTYALTTFSPLPILGVPGANRRHVELRAFGSPTALATTLPGPGIGDAAQDVSADGTKILFIRFTETPHDDYSLYSLGVSSGVETPLNAPLINASYSPDGTRIVAARYPTSELVTLNADGSGITTLPGASTAGTWFGAGSDWGPQSALPAPNTRFKKLKPPHFKKKGGLYLTPDKKSELRILGYDPTLAYRCKTGSYPLEPCGPKYKTQPIAKPTKVSVFAVNRAGDPDLTPATVKLQWDEKP